MNKIQKEKKLIFVELNEINFDVVKSYLNNVVVLPTFSRIFNEVVFVAIKNGEHQAKGFAYFFQGIRKHSPDDDDHVSKIHFTVLKYFNV